MREGKKKNSGDERGKEEVAPEACLDPQRREKNNLFHLKKREIP